MRSSTRSCPASATARSSPPAAAKSNNDSIIFLYRPTLMRDPRHKGGDAMRVACVLDVDFEDSEFRGPHDALTRAGHEVTVIGLEAGRKLTGKRGKEKVTADRGIDQVSAGDFDALLIPGGYSPDHLRADRR